MSEEKLKIHPVILSIIVSALVSGAGGMTWAGGVGARIGSLVDKVAADKARVEKLEEREREYSKDIARLLERTESVEEKLGDVLKELRRQKRRER